MSEDVLNRAEREGLTMWGETITAQFRGEGQLALHILPGAPRDVDGPALVPNGDVLKLYALIAEADDRGEF